MKEVLGGDPFAWTGAIPSHWRHFRLGSCFRERHVATTAELAPALSVTKGGVVEQQEQVAKSQEGAPKKLVQPGDLVINSRSDRKGSAGLASRLGSVSLINTVLEPTGIDAKFAYHLLRSTPFQEEFFRHGYGIVDDLWTTRYAAMKSIQLPVPPDPEQRAIADYLDHETAEIDAFIADQESFRALVVERHRARTVHLATGEPSGPDSRGSRDSIWRDVPAHWTVQKLGWHFDVGNGSTPKSDNPDFWSHEGIPWVNSSVVNEDLVTVPSRFVTPKAIQEAHLPIVPAGSLLIGLTGQGKTRGTVTTLGINTTVNQHVAYITPRSDASVNADFLRLVLEAAYQELRNISDGSGGTKGALTCEDVAQFRIPVAPADEQQHYVSLHQAERANAELMLNDAALAIELARERRAALISAAVTGQIDVTKRRRPVAEVLEDEVRERV